MNSIARYRPLWTILPIALVCSMALPAHAQASASVAVSSQDTQFQSAYVSAFIGYRGFTEQPVTSWQDAHRLVEHIGGWRVYAKEAQQADVVVPSMAPGQAAIDHQGGQP